MFKDHMRAGNSQVRTHALATDSQFTVSVTVELCVLAPAVAATVKVTTPSFAVGAAVSVTIDTPAPLIEAGLKVAVTPLGRPLTDKATVGTVVPVDAVCTLMVPPVPCVTARAVVPTPKTKVGLLTALTTSVTVALTVVLPLTPVTVSG
jgi:hypothetical protein